MKKSVKFLLVMLVLLLSCGLAFAADGYTTFRDQTFAETVGKVPEKTGYEKFVDETFKGFSYDAAKPVKTGYEKFRDETFKGFTYGAATPHKTGYEVFRDNVYPLTATKYERLETHTTFHGAVKVTKIINVVPKSGYEVFRDSVF